MTYHEGTPTDDSSSYHHLPDTTPLSPSSSLHSSPQPSRSLTYALEEKEIHPVVPVASTARAPRPAYIEMERKQSPSEDGPYSPPPALKGDALKESLLTTEPSSHSTVSVSTPPDSVAEETLLPPLPWVMVLLIAAINLNEAFQMNVIWPFLPDMIRDFRVGPDSEIGFWGGLLGASFFAAQLLSSFAWGLVSDRVGRRFVLLYGTAAFTGATLVFGLASTYPVALAARFMAGFLSGNLGTAKVYLSEELDRRLLARGFSALGFSAGFGGIIGPIVGGYLNRPAIQYPTVFSQDGLFGRFPYLLPELISVSIGVVGFIVSIKYLPESKAFLKRLEVKREEAQRKREGRVEPVNAGTPAVETIWTVMKRKQVLVTTSLYGMVALIFIIFDEIFSFFFEAAQEDQGLGYSSGKTGGFLAVTGVSLILFQLLIFPRLVEKVGVTRLFRWSLLSAVPFFLLFPVLSNLERSDWPGELTTVMIGVGCFFRAMLGANVFTPVFILINGSAPQAALGAVNGFAQSQAALWRTVGPLIGGGVWSLSLGWSEDWAQHHHFAPYVVIAAVTVLTYGLSMLLRKKVNEDDPDELEDGTGRRRVTSDKRRLHQQLPTHAE